jgi:hypothetical protein
MIALATLLLAATSAQALDHPQGDGRGTLWLGEHALGAPPALRPGTHLGPQNSVGGRPLQARWEAAQGLHAGATPPLQLPELPRRQHLVVAIDRDLAVSSELLLDYVEAREAEGWEVVLATSDLWDHENQGSDDSRAGRLRAWLAERYADDPGAFLLLIGDPDPDQGSVPMKMTHSLASVVHYYDEWLASELDPMPSDFYYAELDGDWDCDGDGRYAEYPDDAGEGCMDFGPELYVGRLPVYRDSATQLDALLARILARDREADKSYRGRVLLPGALFSIEGAPSPTGGDYFDSSDGASVLDAIHANLPPALQAGATRLYEAEGLVTSLYEHDLALSQDEVVEQWRRGQGLVVWAGHGATDGVYRMIWSEDLDADGEPDHREFGYPSFMESHESSALAEVGGAFTWHISCDNGHPEDEDNLGSALLMGGAAGTVTASRPAFGAAAPWGEPFEPRPDLATSSTAAYYYAERIAAGDTAGEAVAYTKVALPGDGWTAESYGVDFTGAAWATKLEFNLYGDPTRSLELCTVDDDCDDGSPCNGTESCEQGYCVHSELVDCSALDSACTRGACDLVSGACVETPLLDGAPCDDDDWCSEVDSCLAGACGGEERDCGERDGWVSWCDSVDRQCLWEEAPEEEPGGCGCDSAPPRPQAFGLLIGLLALVTRSRQSREMTPI